MKTTIFQFQDLASMVTGHMFDCKKFRLTLGLLTVHITFLCYGLL